MVIHNIILLLEKYIYSHNEFQLEKQLPIMFI